MLLFSYVLMSPKHCTNRASHWSSLTISNEQGFSSETDPQPVKESPTFYETQKHIYCVQNSPLLCPYHELDQFLKLGSAKGCQGFRQTVMLNGGKVLLALLNLCVRIKIRVPTFDTDHPVTDSTQTINRIFNPEISQFCSPIGQLALLP